MIDFADAAKFNQGHGAKWWWTFFSCSSSAPTTAPCWLLRAAGDVGLVTAFERAGADRRPAPFRTGRQHHQGVLDPPRSFCLRQLQRHHLAGRQTVLDFGKEKIGDPDLDRPALKAILLFHI